MCVRITHNTAQNSSDLLSSEQLSLITQMLSTGGQGSHRPSTASLLCFSGVASIGPGRALARPLISQVGPGQARFGCFHDCYLSENNYFDQLNFRFDCHDYIAVTHNRNCNLLTIPSTSSADVLYIHVFIFQYHHATFTSLTSLSANTIIFCLQNVHKTLFT